LLAHGQASGTARLPLYVIIHCPFKVSGDCYKLTCLDNDRGAVRLNWRLRNVLIYLLGWWLPLGIL